MATDTSEQALRFDRRKFLAGTGAMVVAIGAPRLLDPKRAFGAVDEFPIGPALVDAKQIDSWIAIRGDGSVQVFTGKVELGTGVLTTQTQLVADELDVPLSKITMIEGDTWRSPDQGYTAGSQTTPTQFASSTGLRQAAAEARLALLTMASAQLGIPVAQLSVSDGVVSGGGKSVSYAQLIGDRKFNLKQTGKAKPKSFYDYKIVGTSVPRIDVPDKAVGMFTFTQDIKIPGLLHARVVRPPTLDSKLVSVDGWQGGRQPAGVVRVVVKKNFVAVVTKREEQAILAAQQLKVTWDAAPLPSYDNLYGELTAMSPSTDRVLINTYDVDDALGKAAKTLSAEYRYPIQMHGSMGASAATASVEGNTATVWSSTQGVYRLRGALATALGMPAQNVHVLYVEGSGCYGINGADNVALDAAAISQMVGAPVRVQYMRSDEHRWENYGQPYVHRMRGGLDANGKLVAWDSESWTSGRGGRPGPPGNIPTGILLGFPETPVAKSPPPTPSQPPNNVDGSNSAPSYVVKSQRVVTHAGRLGFMAGPLRSPNRIQNTWASESFVDELAHAAGADPLAFRVAHLQDERLVAVLELAARMSKWRARPAASKVGSGRMKTGRGISGMLYEGDNGYNASVAQVTVDTVTGKVVVDHVWSAQDCGPALNPSGMRAQAEGCLMQALSRTLIEEVKWTSNGITSKDWVTYPVARFLSMPKFDFQIIDRKDEAPMGAGEVLITSAPAAIGNAIFDATGKRMRQLPITPTRMRAALKA